MLMEKEEKESWTVVPMRRAVSPPAGQNGVGTSMWVWVSCEGTRMRAEDKGMHGQEHSRELKAHFSCACFQKNVKGNVMSPYAMDEDVGRISLFRPRGGKL